MPAAQVEGSYIAIDLRALADLGDEDIARLWSLCSRDGFSAFDDLVGLTRAGFADALRDGPAADSAWWSIVSDGDRFLGAVRLVTSTAPRWAGLARVAVVVHAKARRRGVGRALVRSAFKEAERRGCHQVLIETRAGCVGALLMSRISPPHPINRRTRLAVADVDRDQLRSWADESALAAGGYEVEVWASAVPEERIESFRQATAAMGDQTLGELEEGVFWRWTGGIARLEAGPHPPGHRGPDRGRRARAEVCGYSRYEILDDQPEIFRGIDTAVGATHRGRGLGRVLSSRMLHEGIERYPWVRYFECWNAVEDVPIGRLNLALGFREVERWCEWQFDIAHVRRVLGGSGA